ncbi:hypothetical protein C7B81_15510, partial [Aphanothece cf. minutissima CCALA 015]
FCPCEGAMRKSHPRRVAFLLATTSDSPRQRAAEGAGGNGQARLLNRHSAGQARMRECCSSHP